jgi:rod shape-determining protein RodA
MLDTVKGYLRYTNWPIILAMVALMAIGISAIRVSEQADAAMREYSRLQTIFAGVALAAFVAATLVPYQRIGGYAYLLFGLTLALLVAVFFLPPIRGSHRWIDLKVFLLQPSELAKISYIIMLAWYLRYGDHYRRLRGLVLPFMLTLVPLGLVLKEPDLGTSLLFLPTLYFMLFMAGAKLRHLLGIVAMGTALTLMPAPKKLPPDMDAAEAKVRRALAYWVHHGTGGEVAMTAVPLAVMEWHQIKRIDGWLRQGDPEVTRGRGYQLHQSKIVLGSGHWTGRGDWNNTDTFFRMLPDDHTDFIFSVIGGQWGFVGCMALLGLYGVIFVLGIEIATVTNDPFGRLLAVGVLALLFTQITVNVGMTMGITPVTGMTLPLVSYGGSSLVVNCFALGLLVNVGRHRPIMLGKRPFEFGQPREKEPPVAVR